MNRLFKRFDLETGIATNIMRDGEDKYDLQYYRGKKTETVTDQVAQVSSAFNEWLNHLWDKVGPQKHKSKRPFNDRINKFMVRKWIEKYIKPKTL